MKFSIITPTYKRSDLLNRAVASVLSQTYKNWELIIINDSPSDPSYLSFVNSINDSRIRYFSNDTNKGVNYSRNRGISNLSADSEWVIFLDDDDYFAPDALSHFRDLVLRNNDNMWFMSNRALKNGTALTEGVVDDALYSYAWSYLIFRKIKGDATHCIKTKNLHQIHAAFSSRVKQGEEWFFFYQLGMSSKILYSDHNSTISDGYDLSSGLNFRKRTFEERYKTLVKITEEAISKKIISFPFLTYITLRVIKLLTGR